MKKPEANEEVPVPLTTSRPADIDLADESGIPDFIKDNAIAIVVGVLVAVVAFVGYTIWKNSQKAKVEAASALLSNSQTAPQFQEIIANYPDTPSAPLAQLSLASSYYDQNQFDLALGTFKEFGTLHANHSMAPVAELGVAQSLEALSRFDEALAAYDQFLNKHAGHYLFPSATFGKARVFEAQQKFADAKAVYEAFIAANPESSWLNRAETGLDFVGKQERAAQTP